MGWLYLFNESVPPRSNRPFPDNMKSFLQPLSSIDSFTLKTGILTIRRRWVRKALTLICVPGSLICSFYINLFIDWQIPELSHPHREVCYRKKSYSVNLSLEGSKSEAFTSGIQCLQWTHSILRYLLSRQLPNDEFRLQDKGSLGEVCNPEILHQIIRDREMKLRSWTVLKYWPKTSFRGKFNAKKRDNCWNQLHRQVSSSSSSDYVPVLYHKYSES